MLTTTSYGARAGATLAELVVALTLAAVVLATATRSLLHQQRTASTIGGAARSAAQLRAATGALATELSTLAAGAGDLAPGEVRDTALQLRTFVAGGTACDDAVGAATFAGEDDSSADAIVGAVPRAGDSLWWYAGASEGGWHGRPIVASDSVAAPCRLTGAPTGALRRVALAGPDTIRLGAHLRVSRPVRYSFYRSGDGSWQLGLRDWSVSTHSFAPPQPIAGPFVMRAGRERSGFRFFDADGVELPMGAAGVDAARVARLRITVLSPDRSAAATRDRFSRDSLDIALQRTRGP